MRDIVIFFDRLPWLIRLILAFPFIDGIAYGIYRIAKGIDENRMGIFIAGIVWLLAGWAVLWIIDLITVIIYGRVTVFA